MSRLRTHNTRHRRAMRPLPMMVKIDRLVKSFGVRVIKIADLPRSDLTIHPHAFYDDI